MLQIILVGQTDLDQLLSRPELRALKQRVSRSVRLDPMSPAEVAQYIDHRVRVARERPGESSIPGARELERELAEWERSDVNAPFTPEAVQTVAQLSRGIPRVVNLLCDRALEAAHALELRTVDASVIGAAAQALALPAAPEMALSPLFESRKSLESPQSVPADLPAPAAPPSRPDAARTSRYLIVAAWLVLVGAAIWFGARAIRQRGGGAPAPPPAAVVQPTTSTQPAPSVATPRSDVGTEPPSTATPSTASPVPPPAGTAAAPPEATPPPAPQPTASAASSTGSTGEAFEIVVASFRTASRATDVAANVAALGQPVRQRSAAGWQQVLAGPYKSAAQARDAQQLLQRAGFAGTQVVPVAR